MARNLPRAAGTRPGPDPQTTDKPHKGERQDTHARIHLRNPLVEADPTQKSAGGSRLSHRRPLAGRGRFLAFHGRIGQPPGLRGQSAKPLLRIVSAHRRSRSPITQCR